jgi:Leucine-rich repeat (LRR) protein
MQLSKKQPTTVTPDAIHSEHPDTHYQHLINAIPPWLGTASPAKRQALKSTRPRLLDSLKAASPAHHRELKTLNAAHWTAQNDVDQMLEKLRDAKSFAEPLLKNALRSRFGLNLDVRKTFLHLYIPTTIPWFAIKSGGTRTWTVSLLDAALHNFEEEETKSGAYEADSTFITEPSSTGQFDILPSIKRAITVQAFTELCRELDIGGQYKIYLEENLGVTDSVVAAVLEPKVERSEKAALKAALQFARMSGDIQEDYFLLIQAMLDGRSGMSLDGDVLRCHDLTMMSSQLTGIVFFAPDLEQTRKTVRVVAYVPDDPEHPIKEYVSSAAFGKELIRQLRSSDYQRFFSRFVAHDQRGHFFADLNNRLIREIYEQPAKGSSLPGRRKIPIENPNLQFSATPINDNLWRYLYQAKLDKILNDARVIAVSTASVDRKARWALWDSFVKVASSILEAALFVVSPFVPFVGELMMAYMAWQLLDETFEGIIDWAQGLTTEAFEHLLGVVESLGQLGVFAVGGAVIASEFRRVLPSEVVRFIDQFKPVSTSGERTRYWRPDLRPYEQQVTLPKRSRTNGLGVHSHEGKDFISIENSCYAVSKDLRTGRHYIEHPNRPDAYKPTLLHNGDGAWYTELEQPLEWDTATALSRIGGRVESFSPAQRERILKISGYSENALRKMHVNQESLPPLLADTIKRFKIDQDLQRVAGQITRQQSASLFESRYQTLQQTDNPLVQSIVSVDPELPLSVAQALLDNATGPELRQINQGQLPERLEELASLAKQEVRITRAYEGLELDSIDNPDEDLVALHTLETMTGWPSHTRIDIRHVSFDAVTQGSIGPENASIGNVLVRQESGQYEIYDNQGQKLQDASDFYSSVLQVLPQTERKMLGVSIDQGPKLKQMIRDNPLERNELRVLLSPRPVRGPVVDTLRLLGADGYPPLLSELPRTLEERAREVYPGQSPEQIQVLLQRLQLHPDGPRAALSRLRNEYAQLNDDLQAWAYHPPTRHPTTNAPLNALEMLAESQNRDVFRRKLLECWRRETTINDAVPEPGYAFEFLHPLLGDLPAITADFSHVHVLSLEGGTAIRGVHSFLERFVGLIHLEIRNYTLDSLPKAIADMPALEELILSRCGINFSSDSQAVLSSLGKLDTLDLSDNPLGRVPNIEALTELNYIDLANTGITQVSIGLANHPNLKTAVFSGNQISELPTAFYTLPASIAEGFDFNDNPLSATTRERIKTYCRETGRDFGVYAEQTDIDRAVALYPNLDTQEASDFIYRLPGTLQEGRIELARREAELSRLRGELVAWVADIPAINPATGHPLSAFDSSIQRFNRELFTQNLEQCWRQLPVEGVATSDYEFESNLTILGELPTLAAQFSHVLELQLTSTANIASRIGRFLESFPNLDSLSIRGYQLDNIPQEVFAMGRLTALDLPECNITFTQQTLSALAGMDRLDHLNLSNNPLGLPPDIRNMERLSQLFLSHTGITEIPRGLLDTRNWIDADLSHNAITEMSPEILEVPPDIGEDLDFTGNPFTEESLQLIAIYYRETSVHFGVEQVVDMPLPESVPPIVPIEE